MEYPAFTRILPPERGPRNWGFAEGLPVGIHPSGDCEIARVFQKACRTILGRELPAGPKPFVDDGNAFSQRGAPTITYGPGGRGTHTLHEEVPLDGLERTAVMYALTAIVFCGGEAEVQCL